MEFILVILVGLLYTAGLYMILRRSLVKVIIGLIFLGHAANLLIFTAGRITAGSPAFLNSEGEIIKPFESTAHNSSLSIISACAIKTSYQALILTAIVIGFGVQAFAIVLFKRAYKTVGTDDLDEMRSTDRD